MNMPKPPLHHHKPIRPSVTHGRDQLANHPNQPEQQQQSPPPDRGRVRVGVKNNPATPHCPNCSLPRPLLHWDGEVYKCTGCGGSWDPPAIQKYPEIFLDEKEGEETVAPGYAPAGDGKQGGGDGKEPAP